MNQASASGVTVEKTVDVERFPVPAVVFDISSSRDEAVDVRIVDQVPSELAVDSVGFHPEYGSDRWTAHQDGRLVYEHRLLPGEDVTTVYGVRDENFGPDLDLPVPDVAVDGEGGDEDEAATDAPETAVEDLAPSERTETVRDAISGEEPLPGSEPAADDELDEGLAEDAADAEPPEPVDEVEEDASESEEDGEPAEPATEDDSSDESVGLGVAEGGVAAALAAEFRAGEVSEADRETLEAELDGVPESADARIERLESQYAELAAYTDALREFIDENGDAEALLADLESSVEGMADRVDAVESEVAAMEDEVASVREDHADLRESLDELADRVESGDHVEDALDDLRADLRELEDRAATGDVESEIDALDADVDELEADVAELRDWRNDLSSAFGGGGGPA